MPRTDVVPAASIALVHEAAEPALLWVRRSDDAPDLQGFHALPGGLSDPADADAPRDHEADPRRVTALRELFEEVGILVADGPPIGDGAARAIRASFHDDAARGHAALAEAGLRWRTSALLSLGCWVTPEFAPRRFDTAFYGLRVDSRPDVDPDRFELEGAEWIRARDALAQWSRGRALITPALASLLRSLSERSVLDDRALRAVRGARGDESQRWEVVPGVWMLPLRTPTLPPATHTNAFLVGTDRAVLVEPATPYADELDRTLRWVDEAREAGLTIEAILATHHHPDHVGGAKVLAERVGAPLWAHRETALRVAALRFDRLLDDGERIELGNVALRALHTPGHAPGHLCFLEERSGAMIAGDMVAGVGTILIDPHDGDMCAYLASLERMAQQDPTLLLPAHGMVLRDPQRTLRDYAVHRRMREAKIANALDQIGGAATIAELVPVAYDDAPRAVWPLAMASTEAHLLKLQRDGRVQRQGARWQRT